MYKARTAYRVATGLFLVGVLGQVFLAGLGIFAHPANFITHVFISLHSHTAYTSEFKGMRTAQSPTL